MDIGEILTLVFAIVGAVGVLVQVRLHVAQIRREELEIRRLEEEDSPRPGEEV
ncbi:MAG: hypothetical protein M9896_13750 [Candidatus Promineofilum sp.]|uniref:hypothetical protein n=1 Tax=Promineifilum sp. TaxID=2664178 RepID=UPI002411D007|nr:hypothetical protein [Promineifilum sp.]